MLQCFKLYIIVLLMHCYYILPAQISENLYKELPDSIKPVNRLRPTVLEKQRLLSNISYGTGTKYFKELNELAEILKKEIINTSDYELKINNTIALGDYYMQTIPTYNSNGGNNGLIYYKKAINYIDNNHKYYNKLGYTYWATSVYYLNSYQSDSAIEYLHLGEAVAKSIQDTVILENIYQGYAILYSQLSLPQKAILYDEAVLKIYPAKNIWDINYTYIIINSAAFYIAAFDIDPKKEYRDNVLKKLNQVMEIKKAEANNWYGSCYYLLGLLFAKMGDFTKASSLLDSSLLPIYNKDGLVFENYDYHRYLWKAACLIKLKRYSDGKKILDSVKIPQTDFRSLKIRADALYDYCKSIGDLGSALKYYQEFVEYKDSVNLLGFRGKVFESEQKYQVSQKEAAIERLQSQRLKDKGNVRGMVIIFLLVLLLLIGLLVFFYLNHKRQLAKKENESRLMTDRLEKMEDNMVIQQAEQIVENEKSLALLRKSISQDMHDELSGSLAALRYIIKDYSLTANNTETQKILGDLEEEANSVYIQMRRFMERVSGTKTNAVSYNVQSFLKNLSNTFNNSTLRITTHCNEDDLQKYLTTIHNTEAYLFIKEAVTNSMKHADATEISVSVTFNNGLASIKVSDNGKGFSYANQGMGMATMQSRMEALGGMLKYWNDNGFHILGSFAVSKTQNAVFG